MAYTGPEKRQKRGTRNGDRNENERRHQVSGGSRLIGHRDVPHRLVYGRAGDTWILIPDVPKPSDYAYTKSEKT